MTMRTPQRRSLSAGSPESLETIQQVSEKQTGQDSQLEEELLPSSSPLPSSSTQAGQSQLAIPGPPKSPTPLEQSEQRLRKKLQAKMPNAHILAHHQLPPRGEVE